MPQIQLATNDASRQVAAEPYIALKNRFCEVNPTLNNSPVSYIARPALYAWQEVGDGPIHSVFDEPGVFGGDLFVWSGDGLYRVAATDGAVSFVGTLGDPPGAVSWAATAPIGAEPAHLFLCAGAELWLVFDAPFATGVLTASGVTANTETVRIGAVHYEFTTGSVDAGTPAGTLADPWLVACTTVAATDLATLRKAINDSGIAGTDYSTALSAHPDVTATGATTTQLTVEAIDQGPDGNGITLAETGANLAWGSGSTTGGGSVDPLSEVAMPDDLGAVSVASINSYVIVVPVQSEEFVTVGQFRWIEPGEITIASGFATAERSPDKIQQVAVYGDLFWLLGQTTTEPWQVIGDPTTPFQRYPGILYDDGSWEGTVLQVGDGLMAINPNGAVDYIAGGRNTVSTPAVEELIRRAIQLAAAGS